MSDVLKIAITLFVIMLLLGLSVGLEGFLFSYQEGGPYLGLAPGTTYTNYRLFPWPFMHQTNTADYGHETIVNDIAEHPWLFSGDMAIWLIIAVGGGLYPVIRRYFKKRKKDREEAGGKYTVPGVKTKF